MATAVPSLRQDSRDPTRILMIYPGLVHELPPILTSAMCLSRDGARVTILAAGCAGETRRFLAASGVDVVSLGIADYPQSKMGRMTLYAGMTRKYLQLLSHFRPGVCWYHGAHGMRFAARWFPAADRVRVAHAHELYKSGSPLDKTQMSALRAADVAITPEENRGWILKTMSGSAARFFVVPNRVTADTAVLHSDRSHAAQLFRRFGGSGACSRLLIYQGLFSAERCLKEVIAAFQIANIPAAGIILLGGGSDAKYSSELAGLARADSRIAIIPRIPAPRHLRVTSGCAAGIVLYAPTELNNIYCAPNKIYEYAHFGLPMILPRYPGIEAIVNRYGLGHVCDANDPNSIAKAMQGALAGDPADAALRAQQFLTGTPDPNSMYAGIHRYIRSIANSVPNVTREPYAA